MSGDHGPTRVSAVLGAFLEKHGVREQVERIGILEQWPQIVGEQLAGVTRVKGLDDDALFVEVRSSAWLMELSLMKAEFLDRVNQRLEGAPLERVVFVLAETS